MNCVPDNLYMEWESSFLAPQMFEPIDASLDLELVLALTPEITPAPACMTGAKKTESLERQFYLLHQPHRPRESHRASSSSVDFDSRPIERRPSQFRLPETTLSLAYLTSFQAHPELAPQASAAPRADLAPPPGSIFDYCSERALHLDAPEPRGALGLTRTFSARRTHALVLQTVRREFAVEDRYRRRIARVGGTRERVRRRRDLTDYLWKPESVYKTFVDCKPFFFDKTSYQDHIPTSLCFGKINMRIPKAWTRGPNKPKRRKAMPMAEADGATFASDFSSDTLQSSTASVLEPSALLESDFLPKLLPQFSALPDEFGLEMLLL